MEGSRGRCDGPILGELSRGESRAGMLGPFAAGRGDRDCRSVVPVGKHGRGHCEPSKGLSGHEGWAEGLLIFFSKVLALRGSVVEL